MIEITVTVDASGTPTSGAIFTANAGMVGSQVLRALNLSTPSNYVNSAPFITFTRVQSNTSEVRYQIQNIVGLVPDEQYRVLIELIPLS